MDIVVVVFQWLIHVWLFATPWTATCQASLSFTIFQSLKLMSTESVMLFNLLFLCCSLILLPSIFPSIKVFSNESALCIRWPKYWSFSISPSNEYLELISFRIGSSSLVQGTLKSLLQHHGLKAPIGSQASIWSSSDICTWLLEKPYLWLYGPLLAKLYYCWNKIRLPIIYTDTFSIMHNSYCKAWALEINAQ